MWKVGDISPVSVLGVDGYPYGFNLTTEDGQPLVSFAYVTRAKAEEAATQMNCEIRRAVVERLESGIRRRVSPLVPTTA